MNEEQKKRIAARLAYYDHREDRCIDHKYEAIKAGDTELAEKYGRWAHTNAARVSVIEEIISILGYKAIWTDDDTVELREA